MSVTLLKYTTETHRKIVFCFSTGTTPGPLMLGQIIDSSCKVWQDICGVSGNCWIYEKTEMGIRIFIWWCLVKGFSIICYFCAQYFYKPPPGGERNDDDDTRKTKKHPVVYVDTKESNI